MLKVHDEIPFNQFREIQELIHLRTLRLRTPGAAHAPRPLPAEKLGLRDHHQATLRGEPAPREARRTHRTHL
ncbi:MAG: hypothetical protein ACK5CF_07000, partial [Opitutaceae bacterium]